MAVAPLYDGAGRRMSLPGFLGAAGALGLDAALARRSNGSGSTAGSALETTEEVSEGSTNPSPTVPSLSFANGEQTGALGGLLPGGLVKQDDEKETEEETVHERIERELNEFEEVDRTGVRFLRAEQGMRIGQIPSLSYSRAIADPLCGSIRAAF